jgi:uncharacterized damage-inducible protein DinB
MNLQDLQVLLDYHYWARDRMLDAVEVLSPEQFTRDLGSSFKSVRDTLAHTYVAEWAWYCRWMGDSPKAALPFEMFPNVGTLRRAWTEHEGKVRAFVDGLDEDGLNRMFEYKLLSGTPGKSLIRHTVQHVVNHATYHRGQVTAMLRQLGAAPAKSMDLDTFYRERTST